MEEKFMKKILVLLLGLVLMMALAGCGNDAPAADTGGGEDRSDQLFIQVSALSNLDYFYDHMLGMRMVGEELGVQTIICTDISKDGILAGTNIELYETLKKQLKINIIASGGVSTLDEIKTLTNLDIHGAIIGKALYTGDIDLSDAINAGAYKTLP